MKKNLILSLLLLLALSSCAEKPPPPDLVPWPQSVEVRSGTLSLGVESRIVVVEEDLLPLAKVLSEELDLAIGFVLENTASEPRPDDIILEIDPELAPEHYILEVSDRAHVRASDYAGVAMGSVTLLQALASGPSIPKMTIQDHPHSSYRGLLLDLARQWHSVETIQQVIVLCRLYKIRYLQLHLTDNQSFTFPTKTLPELPTPGRHYTLAEFRALESFARDRGVTLVPELEMPGHAQVMVSAAPALFGFEGGEENPRLLNMGREKVYNALDGLIGEMVDVFQSSPFFHIGGDEASLTGLDGDPEARAFMEKNDLSSVEELYRFFLVRVNDIVKRHGKKTIVWEGFRKDGEVEIPRDITVMAWETLYQLPQDLLADGYTIINVSWKPLYVVGDRRWSPEYIYGWNLFRWENWWERAPSVVPIQLEATDQVIGGQMCAWEQTDVMEIPSLRRRLPAMSERIWAPTAAPGFADFDRRLGSTDTLLQKLIRPAVFELEGQINPGYEGSRFNRENRFGERLAVEMKPLRASDVIRFTTDGSTPTSDSTRYEVPLELTDSTSLVVQVLDAEGRPRGFPWRTDFELHPIQVVVDGLIDVPSTDPAHVPGEFHERLTVTMSSNLENGKIHYTLDGKPPSPSSPVYESALISEDTVTVMARFFDEHGRAKGEPLVRVFSRVER